MVVFTCNHCGESLQKPKVEKHYFTACRNAPKSLTCVDCFKDFKAEEYTSHVKCVTEQERYSAKGTFPNGVVKKGDAKQESWTEIVKAVVESTSDVKPSQRQILTIMANSANVPRKKSKFVNFIKSASGNKVSIKDVEEVWDIIEKHKQEREISTNGSGVENAKKLEENGSGDKDENKEQDEIGEGQTKKKKKKKSKGGDQNEIAEEEKISKMKKKKSDIGEESMQNGKDELETPVNDDQKDKKKKKKKNVSNVENGETIDDKLKALEETIDSLEPIANEEPVEKSKKKKKSKNVDGNTNNEELQVTTVSNDAADGLKKKKRKSKETNENGVGNNVEENTKNDIELPKKKKKKTENTEFEKLENEVNQASQVNKKESKKRKMNAINDENGDSEEKKVKVEDGNQKQDSNGSCGFCFKEKILEIVKTKKSISLDKLEKKVLSAYQKATGVELSAKTAKKFRKHLKKVANITVADNNVTIVEN